VKLLAQELVPLGLRASVAPAQDKIEHFVVLFMENRATDCAPPFAPPHSLHTVYDSRL
jgi:hypothetical protein